MRDEKSIATRLSSAELRDVVRAAEEVKFKVVEQVQLHNRKGSVVATAYHRKSVCETKSFSIH